MEYCKMDIELRMLLKEHSSRMLKILTKNEDLANNKKSSCTDTFRKEISKEVREFDKALETLLEPHTIGETGHVSQDEPKTNESHRSSSPSKIVKTTPQKSIDSTNQIDSPRSQRYAARKNKKVKSTQATRTRNMESSQVSKTKTVEPNPDSLPEETSPISKRVSKRLRVPNPKYDLRIKRLRLDREPSNRRRDSDDYRPASMEPLVDETPTASTQHGPRSRFAKAMEKRASVLRKTIAFDRPTTEDSDEDADDDDENVRNVEKNTNRSMYYANTLYKSLCYLCDKKDLRLVSHYSKHHPEHEVLIARPSLTMAKKLRSQSELFEMQNKKIKGVCFFCEEVKTFTKSSWAAHILTHTGESLYLCTGCETPFKQKSNHSKCGLEHFETIYELNGSDKKLKGFMCKDCNYLQISKEKLVKHLTSQHDYHLLEVNGRYDNVTLVPDISHVKTTMKYDFIEPETLFKCTICKTQSADFSEFEQHITDDHPKITSYVCCCKKELKFNGFNHLTMLAHLFQHYADLYRCLSCKNTDENIYYRQQGILNHISTEHTKHVCKFQHIHRQTEEQTIVTEIEFMKFMCNVCDEELVEMRDALNHFRANHPSQITDINTFVSKKTSPMADKIGEITTKYEGSQNEYILRQNFLCTKCNYESTSKEDLLAHHNAHHRIDMFEMKSDSTILVHMETNTTKCEKINEKFDRFTAYSCYQCYENNEEHSDIYGTAEEVYSHWLEMHSSTNTFRFYIETLVQCHYCNVISTYKGILQHIEQIHKNSQICFTDVNVYNKCPLCDYSCDTMEHLPAHFQHEHNHILEINIINPNRLTDEQFQRLQKIDVYKKPMCDHCGEIFDSEEGFNTHHELKHKTETKRSKNITENSCKGLVSSCCDQFIRPKDFYNHLSLHSFSFTCQICNAKMKNLAEAVKHDLKHEFDDDSFEYRCQSLDRTLRKMFYRTKVFYGNGLVVYKHNLLGTREDDSEFFENFLRARRNSYRNKIDELMETSSQSS